MIRDEQRVVAGTRNLDQLDASIRGMTSKLPKDMKSLFEKLQKKGRIVVAPVSRDTCAACGMKLAISQVQAVKLAREIHSCPNCARVLYFPASAPRRVAARTRRTEARKPGISRFSSENLMVPNLESTDKEGIIAELARKMESENFIDDGEKLLDEVLRREAIMSTGVEHGMAFPHARGIEGGGLALALGISRQGVEFDGHVDGLTRIIFLIAIPTAAAAFYLKLLAGLAETFTAAEARKTLLAEKDATGLWKALVKLTRKTVK